MSNRMAASTATKNLIHLKPKFCLENSMKRQKNDRSKDGATQKQQLQRAKVVKNLKKLFTTPTTTQKIPQFQNHYNHQNHKI